MELLTYKIVAVVLLVCARLCAGLSPLLLCRHYHTDRSQWTDLGVALSLSLAAGVMLATCFIHLLPQARSAMLHFLPQHTLPVTELLIVSGFFLTFFLDEAVISLRSSAKVFPTSEIEDTTSHHSASNPEEPSRSQHLFRTVLLGLHSFTKGAAVGVVETLGDLSFLFVAVGVHESFAVASLTLLLLKRGETPVVIVVLSVLLTLVMVAGMVVGVVLTSFSRDVVIVAIVRGLAAGNILYTTFYELLTREIRTRALGLISFFLALMGFLLMLALHLLSGEQRNSEPLVGCSQAPQPAEPDYDNSYTEDDQ